MRGRGPSPSPFFTAIRLPIASERISSVYSPQVVLMIWAIGDSYPDGPGASLRVCSSFLRFITSILYRFRGFRPSGYADYGALVVAVGVSGVDVGGSIVSVAVGSSVGVGVSDGATVISGDGVKVGTRVGVTVASVVDVGLGVNVVVPVVVGVTVLVAVPVAVAVGVDEGVGERVGVSVGRPVGVRYWTGVGGRVAVAGRAVQVGRGATVNCAVGEAGAGPGV